MDRVATLVLRVATRDDAATIADLHTRSRAVAYRGFLPDPYLDGSMAIESHALWPDKIDRMNAGEGQVLIAMRAGEAVAFVCATGPDENGEVLIDNLHAAPNRKGGGAGTALLAASEAWARARGARGLNLFVIEGNTPAMGFYASRGWRLAGRRVDRMGGIDIEALRYEKSLG